jgi:aspartate aminotransferase
MIPKTRSVPVAALIHEAMTRASLIRRMFERGNELKRQHGADRVFDFSLGNPILEPPAELFDALAEIAGRRDDGLHRYMTNAGFAHVREAVAAKLAADFPGITADHIVMTVGAAGALNVALKTILDPGDEVVLLVPYFPEYVFYVRNHGGVPVLCETAPDFDLDLEALSRAITPRTRAILIDSPNNPTGRIYPRAKLEALARLLAEREAAHGHPIYLISDEPYREIVYIDDAPPSAATFHPSSFQVYSWSKSLCLAGDRIGYLAVSPRCEDAASLVDGMVFANRTLGFINAPATMQLAVARLLALRPDVGWYRSKRDLLVSGLREIGLDVAPPDGAFYLFPRSPEADEMPFIERALAEQVLLVPGAGFGRPGHFRLSYTVSEQTIAGGLAALARALGRG